MELGKKRMPTIYLKKKKNHNAIILNWVLFGSGWVQLPPSHLQNFFLPFLYFYFFQLFYLMVMIECDCRFIIIIIIIIIII